MIKKLYIYIALALMLTATAACGGIGQGECIDALPAIEPDMIGVTMPKNIAAPRFWLADTCGAAKQEAVMKCGEVTVTAHEKNGAIAVSMADWKRLTGAGDSVMVTVRAVIGGKAIEYKPFAIYLAPEPIDNHLAYRLIEPGYETWHQMGIYQRDLESYEEKEVITNRLTDYGCMNCHSFCMQSPDHMLLHMRLERPGTYIYADGDIERLDTKTPGTISALVYPSWHPTGRYVAFSTNETKQLFHTTDANRIEVFDYASDVVVYDIDNHEVLTTPLLSSKASFETFPTFSPDGKTLYFCTADSVAMPDGYDKVRYDLCSISFDPESREFGVEIDTVYRAAAQDKSVSFPRVSPDGRFLMMTLHDYGNFSIWHHEADLWMVPLDGDQEPYPLDALNSDDTESYHSWSSNGRWVAYSSRRMDGLYTRPFIGYVDANGQPRKPFVVPQDRKDYYQSLMKSYNVPELVSGEVKAAPADWERASRCPAVKIK